MTSHGLNFSQVEQNMTIKSTGWAVTPTLCGSYGFRFVDSIYVATVKDQPVFQAVW